MVGVSRAGLGSLGRGEGEGGRHGSCGRGETRVKAPAAAAPGPQVRSLAIPEAYSHVGQLGFGTGRPSVSFQLCVTSSRVTTGQ